jgi:hypothetical protein
METLVEIFFFIFYMINISKADNFTVNNWFNTSTTGLIIKICSKNLSDSNQTGFNFMKNTTEWGSFKIDFSNKSGGFMRDKSTYIAIVSLLCGFNSSKQFGTDG